MKSLLSALLLIFSTLSFSQEFMTNVFERNSMSLNGLWSYIIDPYETGFYDYRFKEKSEGDQGAYWNNGIAKDKTALIEHRYSSKNTLKVPGDWNSQEPKFLYYEGTVWYQKSFNYTIKNKTNRLFLYFGAVNHKADVYLNGKKLGTHIGGFTPFQFEIPTGLLKEKKNNLVVKVDNKRHKDDIPTLNTDWWNYGGITRDVLLIETPKAFVENYIFKLDTPSSTLQPITKNAQIKGWITLNGAEKGKIVSIEIPELKIKKKIKYNGAETAFSFKVNDLILWSNTNPKLYDVSITIDQHKINDAIGFRTIEVKGNKILLNGKPIFLRGICMHEELATEMRRATSKEDSDRLLKWVKELNANFIRLAHYPHNEHIIRAADKQGFLLWSEIPVYWTINFKNPTVLQEAKKQLNEMISRDQNRASVIIWSVGNETPVSETRTEFMKELIFEAKKRDNSRLVSAALEVHYNAALNTIDDPLGAYTDIVSVNEYLGWYIGLPSYCKTASWKTLYDKPLIISETGAGSKAGFYADKMTRWSEDYQEWFYQEQVEMMKRMPDNYTGIAPWILVDFRSPKRNNSIYQEGWNRKGLISDKGEKKKAFYVLKNYYNSIERNYNRSKKN